MKIRNFQIILVLAILCLNALPVSAQTRLAQKLSGKILLQVESRGEAWYVNPADQKRYFLGRPADALALMRQLALGISNVNLNKIPSGLLDYVGADDDADGLPNNLEQALGTDSNKTDSDNDGYYDRVEIINDYNPLGQGQISIDENLLKQLRGKILLQVESSGAGWYLNPSDDKKYYLGRPEDAFAVMRNLALGITNQNLEQIAIGQLQPVAPPDPNPIIPPPDVPPINQSSVLDQAAASIRRNDTVETKKFFIKLMDRAIEHTMNSLNSGGRLLLANILSGAKLTSSTETEKIYSAKVYFPMGNQDVQLYFHVKKQANGEWLIANL